MYIKDAYFGKDAYERKIKIMEEYLREIESELDYLLSQYEKSGKFSDFVVLDAIEIINRNVQKIREKTN